MMSQVQIQGWCKNSNNQRFIDHSHMQILTLKRIQGKWKLLITGNNLVGKNDDTKNDRHLKRLELRLVYNNMYCEVQYTYTAGQGIGCSEDRFIFSYSK